MVQLAVERVGKQSRLSTDKPVPDDVFVAIRVVICGAGPAGLETSGAFRAVVQGHYDEAVSDLDALVYLGAAIADFTWLGAVFGFQANQGSGVKIKFVGDAVF